MGNKQSTTETFDNFDFHKIPGVHDDKEVGRILIKKALEADDSEKEPWMGSLASLISQTMPERFKKAFDQRSPENAAPAVEVKPYTFWERIGAMPVAVGRLRGRQFYYPYTDFRDYTYDEAGPEEQELRARWLARMFDVSWHWPMIYFTTSFTCCLPLPPVYRTPAVVCCALTSVFLEGMRVYINAGHEREQLDDFIIAKEFWYIKNVEALELGLVPKPKLTEEEKERKYLEKHNKEAEQLQKLAMISKPMPEGLQRGPGHDPSKFGGVVSVVGGAQVQHPSGKMVGGKASSMMPDPVQGMLAATPGIPQNMVAGGAGGGTGSFGGGGFGGGAGAGAGGRGGALGGMF